MPLDFSEVEARLARKLGDSDLASALTRELQAHFAESLISRLEAGYSQEEALTATEREFGKARNLVRQVVQPYVSGSRRWAFLAPLIGIFVFFQCQYLIHYIVGRLDDNGGFFSGGLAIASWIAVVVVATCIRRAHILVALGGVFTGALLTVVVTATYYLPFNEYGGLPFFAASERSLQSIQYKDVDPAKLDQWAINGNQAFWAGQKKVPASYRNGNGFLAPVLKESNDPWPLLSTSAIDRPRLPLMEYVTFDVARTRWQQESNMVLFRYNRVQQDQLQVSEVEASRAMTYFQKVERIGWQLYGSSVPNLAVTLLFWWGYLLGSALSFLGRQSRNRRHLKRAA